MDYRYDTYCGLYCGACPILRANRQGVVEEQAAEWKTTPEEITCHGCKSSVVFGYCRTCEMKACAAERELEACVECGDYPCERVTAFRDDAWPHHSVVVRNSEALRAVGLQEWLEDQVCRWRCSECGSETTWYDEACPSCGAAVASSRAEEAAMRADEGGS